MIHCLKSLRDGECFCSRYDENRQTMFYCGFFTTIAGFIWFIIGFIIRCAFFAEAFGPSVDAVACGIMVVGLMILIVGLISTISIVCTSKTNNKTGCVSRSTYNDDIKKLRHLHDRIEHKDKAIFEDPMKRNHRKNHSNIRTASFSSNELNLSFATTSSSAMSSSRPSTSSQNSHSYRSDIAFIA